MAEYNENTYISPDGNPEIWIEKPEGYYTLEEWKTLHSSIEVNNENQKLALKCLVQQHLDETAYSYGYTGIDGSVNGACLSVCSYFDSENKKFDVEGKSFRKWRSAVWTKFFEIIALIENGKLSIHSEEELIKMLPKLEII